MLRLLLDSGAGNLIITRKVAERSNLTALESATLVCPGDSPAKSLRIGQADVGAAGPVVLRRLPRGSERI